MIDIRTIPNTKAEIAATINKLLSAADNISIDDNVRSDYVLRFGDDIYIRMQSLINDIILGYVSIRDLGFPAESVDEIKKNIYKKVYELHSLYSSIDIYHKDESEGARNYLDNYREYEREVSDYNKYSITLIPNTRKKYRTCIIISIVVIVILIILSTLVVIYA